MEKRETPAFFFVANFYFLWIVTHPLISSEATA
jgi:hypothetical protein